MRESVEIFELRLSCATMIHSAYGMIFAAAVFNIAFALFHVAFWRLFRWPEELQRVGIANRGIMQVLNLSLIFLFLLIGCVFALFPRDIVETGLGQFLLLGMTWFWLVRAVYQPLFFGWFHPLSTSLFGVFLLGAAVHALAWWGAQ